MSEHACWAEAREALREVLGVEGPARQIVLANVLAAAEERGRRAGIEEAAKLVRAFAYSHPHVPVLGLVEKLEALAPRDSGKEGTGHHVSIPLPLAQRILAALEDWAGHDGAAIAAELRAAVERKP